MDNKYDYRVVANFNNNPDPICFYFKDIGVVNTFIGALAQSRDFQGATYYQGYKLLGTCVIQTRLVCPS